MADKSTTTIPDLITSDDANNFVLTIGDKQFLSDPNPIITIEIVSGTWNFAKGEPAAGSAASYTTGDKLIITLRNSRKADGTDTTLKLNCKADAGSRTFKVSY